jgi:hypothetical protein
MLYKITKMLQNMGCFLFKTLKKSARYGSLSHSGAGREGFNPGQPINRKREDLLLFSRNNDLLPLNCCVPVIITGAVMITECNPSTDLHQNYIVVQALISIVSYYNAKI